MDEEDNQFLVFVLTEDSEGNVISYTKQEVATLEDGKNLIKMLRGWKGNEVIDGYVVPMDKAKAAEQRLISIINGKEPTQALPTEGIEGEGAYWVESVSDPRVTFIEDVYTLNPRITKVEVIASLVENFSIGEPQATDVLNMYIRKHLQ